eukprot:SAG22_NODE_836_length_6913_cov_4.894188_3_plen_59_part_00
MLGDENGDPTMVAVEKFDRDGYTKKFEVGDKHLMKEVLEPAGGGRPRWRCERPSGRVH